MPVDVEVRPERLAGLADAIGFVRLEAVQGEAIFVGVDRDGADAELVRERKTRMAISLRLATRSLRIGRDRVSAGELLFGMVGGP